MENSCKIIYFNNIYFKKIDLTHILYVANGNICNICNNGNKSLNIYMKMCMEMIHIRGMDASGNKLRKRTKMNLTYCCDIVLL